jgi:hypothetical protein
MTNTISAAANPAMANKAVQDMMAEKPKEVEIRITPPSDTVVTLPGGYITSAGEVTTEAEVRELNGRDEEEISKATTLGKALITILKRGTVRVGNEPVTDTMLDNLLSGDRDMLLLGIFKATFGNIAHLGGYCGSCAEAKDVDIEIDKDIQIKVLTDPVNDRTFVVKGKSLEYTVTLPTGMTQKELMLSADKTVAELNTLLLEQTIIKIGEAPVVSKIQVQNLGLTDRRKIVEEINKRICGPQFNDLTLGCPDCEGEVQVPISLGTLFRF